MVLNSFAFSFAIMFTLLKKKIYGNTEKTAPEKKSYRVVSSVGGVVVVACC